MKNLLFISILILAFDVAAFAQTDKVSPCPVIEVSGPAGLVRSGETMTFTVKADENYRDSLKYEWTVSAGIIIKGQDSPVIKIATTPELAGVTVTATVKIKNLPENCADTFSEYVIVDIGCGLISPLDEYGTISLQDEKLRLSYIAHRIKEQPTFIALFIINFTKQESLSSIKNRVARISKLLSETHGIAKDRLKFAYFEDDTQSNTIHLLPPNAIDSFPGERNLEKIRPANQTSKNSVPEPKQNLTESIKNQF